MKPIEPISKPTRAKRRYDALKASGLCIQCGGQRGNNKTCCEVCLEKRRKKATGLAGSPSKEPNFCTTPLVDVLRANGIRIRYSEDQYEYYGNHNFTHPRGPGVNPFDGLRAKGLIP